MLFQDYIYFVFFFVGIFLNHLTFFSFFVVFSTPFFCKLFIESHPQSCRSNSQGGHNHFLKAHSSVFLCRHIIKATCLTRIKFDPFYCVYYEDSIPGTKFLRSTFKIFHHILASSSNSTFHLKLLYLCLRVQLNFLPPSFKALQQMWEQWWILLISCRLHAPWCSHLRITLWPRNLPEAFLQLPTLQFRRNIWHAQRKNVIF